MDQIGLLQLSWAQGYNGGRACYIDKEVICYQCGNNIKFVSEDGAEIVFDFPGKGVGPLAVHAASRCFAVAEQCLNPKIYVFVYPTFREMSLLQNGAKLEYLQMFFSNSDFLCTLSGIPEFQLTLWNYVDGRKLCTYDLSSSNIPTSMSFNPGNWRQICVTSEKHLLLLNIEQCDKQYVMQSVRVQLPPVDPDAEEEEESNERVPTRASTHMTRYTIDVPKTAIAGLVGDMSEQLEDIQRHVKKVIPFSHVWTPIGDVYVGCKEGHLLKVDGETQKGRVIYRPPKITEHPGSRISSAGFQRESMVDIQQSSQQGNDILLEGSVNCIGLHKLGLYCAGENGTLHLLDIKTDDLNIIEQCHIGVPVTSLAFSPSYKYMALGSSKGTLHLYEPGVQQSLKLLKDIHYGQIVGIACLPNTEHCVSCREDGEVQVWSIDKGTLVSTYTLDTEVTSLACSPVISVCAVGTAGGYICYLDISKIEDPRLIHKVKVYDGAVTHLVYEDHGLYLLSASGDGHVFVIDGHASSYFKPLAHTEVSGEIQALSIFTDAVGTIHVTVTHNPSGKKQLGATYLTFFEITEKIMKDLRSNCNSLKYDFKDKSIKKISIRMALPSHGAALAEGRTFYTIAQNSKRIQQHSLPKLEEMPSKQEYEQLRLEPTAEYPGHHLPGGCVLLTPHKKWLASYGTDGAVLLRAIGQMANTVSITPHDYRSGGVRAIAFSEDNQHIVTTGYDGILACYSWNYSPVGVEKAKSGIEIVQSRKSKMASFVQEETNCLRTMDVWKPQQPSYVMGVKSIGREEMEKAKREEAVSRDELYQTPTPIAEENATWLQVQELEAFKEEDKQYVTLKKNLRSSIRDMRRTLQTMLRNNETLPEIERLNRHEFDLDMEEQLRLQAEADLEVERVREEIEFENLAKMYLKEMIKRECWDEMVVKGRAVLAFNSNLEVSNFPMLERLQEVKKLIETVTKRRKIEIAEAKARKDIVEKVIKPLSTTAPEDELGDGEDDDRREQPSTSGSLGALYGGGSELFYSQFELHSREQKIAQIVLLEDAIHKIKVLFNKEFDDLYVKKEQEISKIKEKNKRIRKIIADLDLFEDVIEPSMCVAEKPETLLTVDDSEVKVEKYYTPEQQKIIEKKKKEDEEKRARERGENARERALNDMMGGVLEIKKEDELKKDIPKPAFMTQKAENEWTEDEQKASKDYERRVKELQDEREKYRKQLETELRKNQGLIQEGMAAFDDMLNNVFMKKIKVMMVIYQEELKILRLRYSLLLEEELKTRELELKTKLEQKQQLKQVASQAVLTTRKNVEAFREQYDILLAEDKVMDRTFKREFNDVSSVQQDQLYRLFRRRPRALKITKTDGESSLPNPFADHPSTSRQNAQAKAYLDGAMEELDKPSNCPDGVDKHIWDRLCMYRRQKVDNENLVKMNAQILADMTDFMQRREKEETALINEIEELVTELDRLSKDQAQFTLNLEVQLLLKQGQVEVDSGPFIHNFKDSILIHRNVVEDLNSNIKQLGESKIASMVESKDFRKGIIQLEWEHKKMLMLMEDLMNKMKDIQFMKVTREIQLYLNSRDYEGKKTEEIGKLEQTILQQKKIHEKAVEEKKHTLRELERTIKQRNVDNEQLLKELEELNVAVYERKHIEQVNADQQTDQGAEKRYQEIVQRRKLVDLAKAQAQEVAVLRAEVERLRMRTFPALVQVEH